MKTLYSIRVHPSLPACFRGQAEQAACPKGNAHILHDLRVYGAAAPPFKEFFMTRETFEIYARRHMDAVFRLAMCLLKSKADADDVTQNTLLALYRTDTVFESDAHVKNWLMHVAANECRKVWRSPWKKRDDFEPYAETLVFDDSASRDLFDAVMALDKDCRGVILLHYYEGYGMAEIADILHIPPGTVGSRLSRARKKLKRVLTEEA